MANNFSTDPSCKALWRFNPGALATDSSGNGNTFGWSGGSPTSDTTHIEPNSGLDSIDFASGVNASIADASLGSGFPLKSGDSTKLATFSFGLYLASLPPAYSWLFSKVNYNVNSGILLQTGSSGSALQFLWGYGSGYSSETVNVNMPGGVLTAGHFYRFTIMIDGVNKILKIYVYDETAGTCGITIYTATNVMQINSAGFSIVGGSFASTWAQFIVFNRLLNLNEICAIVNQNYAGAYAAASPGNSFSGDSHFYAQWRFESGAVGTDSIGSNNLTLEGSPTPAADPFGVCEGADAAYLNGSTSYFQIVDLALAAGFPLKNGDSVKQITLQGWIIPTAWGGSYPAGIWWKDNGSNVGAGAFINSSGHIVLVVGNLGAPTYIDTGFALNPYELYNVAFVLDGVNGTLKVRVFSGATQSASNYTTTISAITVGAGNFTIGKNISSGTLFNGWLDEFIVANALLSDTEIDAIRGEIFGAPITRNLSTTASVVSSTSSVMLGVTRKLATSPAVSTSTGSPLLNILRKLTCSPAAGSSTSAVMLAVLRKLACSPAVVSSVSTPNLAVQRNLATLAVALSETSDTVYLNLNAVRQLSTIAAVVSSTSAVNLAILRKLVSECVVVTSTPEVMLAVLRKLTTDIPVVSTTSAAELGYLLRLATAANVTTETPTIILQVLRRLLTRVAVQTETSAAQLIITAAPVPLPPSLHSLAEGWLAGEVPTEDLFKASQAWLAGEEQKAEE